MQMEARVSGKPGFDPGMFVRRIIVGDGMNIEIGRCATVDRFEKLQKFLVAVPFHALPDNLAFQNIQRGKRGKQCRGAVAFVIMRHGSGTAFFHRQSGLGTVKRLYLCLFIEAEHQSMFRRVQIKTHDIFQFFNKVRIVRQLEGLDQMRLQPMAIPNTLHGCLTDAADPAIVRQLQCVSWGGGVCVFSTTSASLARSNGLKRRPRGRSS